jgi:hypothetical protein
MSFAIKEDYVIPGCAKPSVKLEKQIVVMSEEPRGLLNQEHLRLRHLHSAGNFRQVGLHGLTNVDPVARVVGR